MFKHPMSNTQRNIAIAGGIVLLLVQSALSDPGATVDCLRAAGLKAAVTQRQRIAFGPVLRRRVEWLRERTVQLNLWLTG